jgi:hypothetical protein
MSKKRMPGPLTERLGRDALGQAAHLQAGVQVLPGWHLHAAPHVQAGPHAQDISILSVAGHVAVEGESRPASVGFI